MYRPWLGRTFGVEMEMNDIDTARNRLTEGMFRRAFEGIDIEPNSRDAGYYHSDGTTWDIKLDASCGVHGYGFEISSPAMLLSEGAENEELKRVCNMLAAMRPRIDRKCGLHVHVACSDFDWKDVRNLVTLWTRYEPFFYELTPVSRRDNQYCVPYRATRWGQRAGQYFPYVEAAISATDERTFQANGGRIPRNSSLNVSGWWRNGRVEFRLGAGTVSYEKIIRWVQLVMSLCGRVKYPFAGMPPVFSGQYSERGFTPLYVFKTLGLAASDRVPATEIAPESVRLLEWAESRKTQHAEPSRVAAYVRPRTRPGEFRVIDTSAGAAVDAAITRAVRF
jgi:hypothetical protein